MSSVDVGLPGRVIFSTSEDGFRWAVRELQDAFGAQLEIQRLGPDVGAINSSILGAHEVSEACFRRPIAFVRHLTVEQRLMPLTEAKDLDAAVNAAVSVITAMERSAAIAVQAWVSGSPQIGYTAGKLAGDISTELENIGYSVARAGQENVLSCCITAKGLILGVNRLKDSLVDWPGGRMRLGKGDERVSRAEFKLEELFALFPLNLREPRRAIDLGAAPGGWTRILRQYGLEVWAVDPADLAPELRADRGVHHEQTTAGEFIRRTSLSFDIVVNDMRMDPLRSCAVIVDAARRLSAGAWAVVTLKTGTHDPVTTMRRCLDVLGAEYEVLFARQLHHNRHELTVVARRLAR